MKAITLCSAITISLLCVGCSPKKIVDSKIAMETIDFGSFRVVEGFIPEYVIKNKRFITLDTSQDDFLFGNIRKVKIVDDVVYILAWQPPRSYKLIVFDSNGLGIGKVGNVGRGPGEYLQITDFDVNDAGDIYFIDGTGAPDRLFLFDKNLQYISVLEMPFEANLIHCLPNNKMLFGLATWNKGEFANQKTVVTNIQLEAEASFLEYDAYIDHNFVISYDFFAQVNDKILYNTQTDNYIHQFAIDGALEKSYYFDFGKKNIPDEDKKDIEGNWEKFQKHYCCLKNFAIINNKYIAGLLLHEGKTKSFLVERETKTLNMIKENISGFYKNQIISVLSQDHIDILSEPLPISIQKHIENGGFVLCLYELM